MARLALAFGFVGALSLILADVGCSTSSAGAGPGPADGQACPADLPQTGSTCSPEGAECRYETATNACGADNCYCQGGAWSCEPTCVLMDASGPAKDGAPEASGPGFCVDAGPVQNCADADIQASNYDQTCQVDSDCILVTEGPSCTPCSCGPTGAISHAALSKFEADIAQTPGGQADMHGGESCAPCCGPVFVACCQGGACRADVQCSVPPDAGLDAGPDAADASGDSGPADARPE